jgi:hypothetical protein
MRSTSFPSRSALGTLARLTPIVALALMVLQGCGRGTATAPRETFNWTDRPVSLEPPDAAWRREGDNSAGVLGARFVKERSVGEAISVGEWTRLAKHQRRAELQTLLDRVDTIDRRDFPNAASRARMRTDDPFTDDEAQIAATVNGHIDTAVSAFLNGDRDEAKLALGAAIEAADKLHYTLPEVIDLVEFKPERRQDPSLYQVTGRRDAVVAGEPAVVVDYTVTTRERVFAAREVYLVHDSRLYVATFIGLEANLALFDRVVGSLQFP